jgi:hypothetical protein
MSESATTIFTQWECEVVIYRADESGAATEEVEWLGGCDNKMELEQGFAEERADRSGDPYSRWQQLEEEHTLDLERLWLTRYDRAGNFANPAPRRNQRLVAVLLWRDEEARIWHKRTYYGVQVGPLAISSESEYFSLRVPLKAAHLIASSGDLDANPPDLSPDSLAGTLRYIDDLGGSIDLFSYNYETNVFTAIGSPDARLSLPGPNGTYQFRLLINGTLALAVNNAGLLLAKEFHFTGATYSTTSLPRVEFVTARRIATLTETGILSAPSFVEQDDPPETEPQIALLNGVDWLASLDNNGLTAPEISDELP